MQIAHAIEVDLQDGFEAGDLYLSEKALTEKFGVNRHTVRRAVEELVKRHVLEKRHGFGTFVAEKRMAYSVNGHQRLTASIEEHGFEVTTSLLDKQIIAARGSVAEKLNLANGADVIQIDTLRKIEDKVVAIISHYLPKAQFSDLLENYEAGSLGSFLAKEYGLKPKRISSQVSATIPNAKDSFQLGISSSNPILKVKTLNVNLKTNSIVEYSVTRFRSDMIQLELIMQ